MTSNISDYSPSTAIEKPLSKRDQYLLLTGATSVLLLGYLFSAASLLIICLIVLFEFLGYLLLIRVAIGYFLLKPMRWMARIAGVLARSLSLPVGDSAGITLSRSDAPELFAMVEDVAGKVGVSPPGAVMMSMDRNASVELHGRSTGKGHTVLWLGYDVMAVMSANELEAIIAHEMAHARLVHRGWSHWLTGGVVRIARFAQTLNEIKSSLKDDRKTSYTVNSLLFVADALGRAAARLQAGYSRQEEFAADLLASDTCGSQITGRALLKWHMASHLRQSISRREKLIRLGREEDYAAWTRSTLLPNDDAETEHLQKIVLDPTQKAPYDTHPSLPERLAAIGYTEMLLTSTDNFAISLLSNADAVLKSLDFERQRKELLWEKEDSAQVRAGTTKGLGDRRVKQGRFFSGLLIALGLFLVSGVVYWGVTAQNAQERAGILPAGATACMFIAMGIVAYLQYRRERIPLPVPRFAKWIDAWTEKGATADDCEWYNSLETELKAAVPSNLRKRKELAVYWGDLCFKALEDCDYKTAMIAADNCLRYDKRSAEGLLGSGISRSYFKLHSYAAPLDKAAKIYGGTTSVTWALGWVGMNWNDCKYAQGYLLETENRWSSVPGVLGVLALCLKMSGKPAEAISHLQIARNLDVDDVALRRLLVGLLLICGEAKEALSELNEVERLEPDTLFVLSVSVWAETLLGHSEKAEELSCAYLAKYPGAESLFDIAVAFRDGGLEEQSLNYFERATEAGFHPEALLALAEARLSKKDMLEARRLALLAIDQTKEAAEGAEPASSLFYNAFQVLNATNGDPVQCRASWVSHRPPVTITNVSTVKMLVCAPTPEQSQSILNEMLAAMYPGLAPSEESLRWSHPAPEDIPKTPVSPGIHGMSFVTDDMK
ncbi:MAG TPA: M48 family metallopeptidase [Armatimonadota bacterium]|jgi:Zn-dependent protease with chaperone function